MEVKQIYELVNTITNEVLGKGDIVKEDLSNVVDVGTELFNANAVDSYVRALVNHIGKVIFVNRVYRGTAPSVLMDGWEFGSVLEKVRIDLPDAQENESWNLVDGASYDTNVFYQPKVSAKFFNSKVTFEIPVSITEKQVKQSFSNATQLNAFLSMIYTAVENSLTIKIDELIMRTINNMVAETLNADGTDGIKAINLLQLFNTQMGVQLQPEEALRTPEFLRFASYTMSLYVNRLNRMSTLFNVGGKERFTPNDKLHFIVLNDFAKASAVYLQSDTYHKELIELPLYEVVPYWQGTGDEYDLASISNINITTGSGADVNAQYVIGVMFDHDALGVCNVDRRVTTNYNAKAEFYNNYYKFDAQYFNDLNENFIVFMLSTY